MKKYQPFHRYIVGKLKDVLIVHQCIRNQNFHCHFLLLVFAPPHAMKYHYPKLQEH